MKWKLNAVMRFNYWQADKWRRVEKNETPNDFRAKKHKEFCIRWNLCEFNNNDNSHQINHWGWSVWKKNIGLLRRFQAFFSFDFFFFAFHSVRLWDDMRIRKKMCRWAQSKIFPNYKNISIENLLRSHHHCSSWSRNESVTNNKTNPIRIFRDYFLAWLSPKFGFDSGLNITTKGCSIAKDLDIHIDIYPEPSVTS